MYDQFPKGNTREEVGNHYRSMLLGSPGGREMFTHMLSELGFFENTEGKSERELGRFDYALRLLEIMAIPNYNNLHRFVEDMAKYPEIYPKIVSKETVVESTSMVVEEEE